MANDPDNSMEIAFHDRPYDPLKNDRRHNEPWPDRWFRLFGIRPNMKEQKSTTNCRDPRERKLTVIRHQVIDDDKC